MAVTDATLAALSTHHEALMSMLTRGVGGGHQEEGVHGDGPCIAQDVGQCRNAEIGPMLPDHGEDDQEVEEQPVQ